MRIKGVIVVTTPLAPCHWLATITKEMEVPTAKAMQDPTGKPSKHVDAVCDSREVRWVRRSSFLFLATMDKRNSSCMDASRLLKQAPMVLKKNDVPSIQWELV